MTNNTQKITPHLWFDKEAEEAAEFYVSVFENSGVESITHYTDAGQEVHGQPEGQVMTVEFELEGQNFVALNGGPMFSFNPSISLIVNCKMEDEVDELWGQLSDGGEVLMPLDSYPFSDRYGWTEDRYGVSWQLVFADNMSERKIVPSLMFVGDLSGNAEDAINFYTSVFSEADIGDIARYDPDHEPDKEGAIMYADFQLEGEWFAGMDSAQDHDFNFNEAISFIVHCEDQEEVDYYWEKLSADPEAEQCGWLKDKYGVSWQIIPKNMNELVSTPSAMESMLQMKKIDIKTLEQASNGEN